MRSFFFVTIAGVMLLCISASAQNGLDLIADYPLQSNANDATGTYGPMTLTNAPFSGGGIYCNGIYADGTKPEACNVYTPIIAGIDMDTFAISARFRVDEFPTVANMPVFAGGMSYRWLGFFLSSDSTVTLLHNNGNFVKSTTKYSLQAWHEGVIVFQNETASLYLNKDLVVQVKTTLNHGDNKNVSLSNGAQGTVFKGYLADLRIYSAANPVGVNIIGTEIPENITLSQNYPNPFNPATKIRFSLPERQHIVLTVYNSLGQTVVCLIDDELEAGVHEALFNAESLPGGVYYYRLQSTEFVEQRKLMLLK
jgi:hypothetical protein